MPKLLAIVEIVGFLALLAGMILIPSGISLVSSAIGLIVAGVELAILGGGLLWFTNPTISQRRQVR